MAVFLVELKRELHEQLWIIARKPLRYKDTADNLIPLIEKIQPMIREIENSGVELPAHDQTKIDMLNTSIEKGKELIEKFHSCHRWNSLEQIALAKRINKLEVEMYELLCGHWYRMKLAEDTMETESNNTANSDQVEKTLKKMSENSGSMEIGRGGMIKDSMNLAEATTEIDSTNTEARMDLGKEIIEEWEFQYGPLRFAYEDLSIATNEFNEKQLLGRGGFGQVYKGSLPGSHAKIAVKRTSHDSRQGMSEFLAEISTIGCLRHPNLVRLLGYCKHKEELFLVYIYMPNGSLDKYISRNGNQERLTWEQRFKIIKDVASGLLYMHQEWKQVIIHRDIKPANVLIDHEMNERLGEFGLAKLCGHGFDAQTSKVAGTLGYMAPEFFRTGRATTNTDVYAFGVVMLEVVCGRRLLEQSAKESEEVLGDWILDLLEKGDVIDAAEESIRQKENEGKLKLF